MGLEWSWSRVQRCDWGHAYEVIRADVRGDV